MGGTNSGRYRWRNRGAVEGCIGLDVRKLQRSGWLRPGCYSIISWETYYDPKPKIGLRAAEEFVELGYSYAGGPQFEYRINLDRTACNYGGSRLWFRCYWCNRRVAKLYLFGGQFRCRHCHRLTYSTQSMESFNKTRMRLIRRFG